MKNLTSICNNSKLSQKFRLRLGSNFFSSSNMSRKNDSENFITMSVISFEKIHFQEKRRYFYFASYIQTDLPMNQTIYRNKLPMITAFPVQIWERLNWNWQRSCSFNKSARRVFITLEIPLWLANLRKGMFGSVQQQPLLGRENVAWRHR